jgi:hypothetical protein
VLSQGRTADAVHPPVGVQYVSLSWTDSAGHQRSASAWTSKRFAREYYTQPAQSIQYVEDPRIDAVILSEVTEREQSNHDGIISSAILALLALAMTVAVGSAYNISRERVGVPE